jgi:hypothetical protein
MAGRKPVSKAQKRRNLHEIISAVFTGLRDFLANIL